MTCFSYEKLNPQLVSFIGLSIGLWKVLPNRKDIERLSQHATEHHIIDRQLLFLSLSNGPVTTSRFTFGQIWIKTIGYKRKKSAHKSLVNLICASKEGTKSKKIPALDALVKLPIMRSAAASSSATSSRNCSLMTNLTPATLNEAKMKTTPVARPRCTHGMISSSTLIRLAIDSAKPIRHKAPPTAFSSSTRKGPIR